MRELLDEVHPDCQWVFAGEGVATRKYDGTCVKIENGDYFKRREVEKDGDAPEDFIEEQFDENTGKRVGWILVDHESKENRWHMDAYNLYDASKLEDGTYELLGPKIQKNPERLERHCLFMHKYAEQYTDVPRTYEGLMEWLSNKDIEGIVFHHPDGRMGKIKKKDFGQKRIQPANEL